MSWDRAQKIAQPRETAGVWELKLTASVWISEAVKLKAILIYYLHRIAYMVYSSQYNIHIRSSQHSRDSLDVQRSPPQLCEDVIQNHGIPESSAVKSLSFFQGRDQVSS